MHQAFLPAREHMCGCVRVCAHFSLHSLTVQKTDLLPLSGLRLGKRGSGMPAGGEGSQGSKEGPSQHAQI